MAAVIDKDLTLSGELAYDSEKNQQVVILYTWENVFAECGCAITAEIKKSKR